MNLKSSVTHNLCVQPRKCSATHRQNGKFLKKGGTSWWTSERKMESLMTRDIWRCENNSVYSCIQEQWDQWATGWHKSEVLLGEDARACSRFQLHSQGQHHPMLRLLDKLIKLSLCTRLWFWIAPVEITSECNYWLFRDLSTGSVEQTVKGSQTDPWNLTSSTPLTWGPAQCRLYSVTHTRTRTHLCTGTQQAQKGVLEVQRDDAGITVHWYLPLITVCEGHLSPALVRLSINHCGIGMMGIYGGSSSPLVSSLTRLRLVAPNPGRCAQ